MRIIFELEAVLHPFQDANIVFTGKLQSMTRSKAVQKVTTCGGNYKTSVTKNTQFLIIGDDAMRKRHPIFYSTKMQVAERLINEGYSIEVMSESDFLALTMHVRSL